MGYCRLIVWVVRVGGSAPKGTLCPAQPWTVTCRAPYMPRSHVEDLTQPSGLGLAYFTWFLPWEAGGAETGVPVIEGAWSPHLASLALCGAALLLMCLSSSDPALSWAPREMEEVRLRAPLSRGSQPSSPDEITAGSEKYLGGPRMFKEVIHVPGRRDSGEINSDPCPHSAKELTHRILTKRRTRAGDDGDHSFHLLPASYAPGQRGRLLTGSGLSWIHSIQLYDRGWGIVTRCLGSLF